MPALLPPALPASSAYEQGVSLGASLAQIQHRLQQDQAGGAAAAVPQIPESAQAQAAAAVPNLQLLMRRTIDGSPVIPPGMTVKQASMYVSHDWMAEHIQHAKTLVFISLSMPRETIRRILADIWNDKKLRGEAVVIVRGWQPTPTGLPELVQAIGELQPGLLKQVNVAVDPSLFESYGVKRVPMVARQISPGRWVSVSGDRLLPTAAVSALDAGKDDGKTLGQTWPIAEPDMIQVMSAKMKAYDWVKHARQANANFFTALPRNAPPLPESPKGLTYFYNPSVVVTHDIRLPDGRLVAAKGQVINPLDQTHMPWSTWKAAIFNAQVPWEVAQAKKWATQYPGIRLMMTNPPDTQAGYVEMEKAFGRPVFVASPLVTQRLGVTNSPALIWPRGSQLQIFVPPIPNDPSYASNR